MAKLELELGVRDSGQLIASISNVDKALADLDARYGRLSKKIAEATFTSRELEGELGRLNSAFKSGAISEAAYVKETNEVKTALASARGSLATYQAQLLSVRATTLQITDAQEKAAKSTQKLEGYHKSFSTGIRSTNTISVEFARTLSDLPYGVQGVGNNVQQLAQNWAYYVQAAQAAAKANGTVLTSTDLVKGVFKSMLSPINLFVLGITALTTAYIFYEKYQQRVARADEAAAKARKTLSEQTQEYVNTLSLVRQAQISASVSAEGESTRLNTLRRIIEDTTKSNVARTNGIKTLKKEFPGYFDGIKNEALLNGTAGDSYEKLTKQIIASAQARSYADKLADSALVRQGLEDQLKEYTRIGRVAVARQKVIQDEINSYSDIEGRNARITKYAQEQAELRGTILDAAQKVTTAQDGLIPILEQEQKLLKGIEDATAGSLDNLVVPQKAIASVKEFGRDIKAIFDPNTDTGTPGLSNLDASTEKIRKKYAELYKQVDEAEKDGLAFYKKNQTERNRITSEAATERVQIAASEAEEYGSAVIAEENRVLSEINRIRGEYGIRSEENRAKELAQAKQNYDKEIGLAKGNARLLTEIEAGYIQQRAAINAKYDAKEFEEFAKITERMMRNRSRGLMEQLREETIEKVKVAKGDAVILEQIALDYNKRIAEITKRSLFADSFTGDAFGQVFADLDQAILEVRNKFKDGVITEEEFTASITRLTEVKSTIDVLKSAAGTLGDTFANVFTDILFDTENVLDNIGKAVNRLVSDIIRDLIRIQIVKAIGNAFTGGAFGGLGKLFGFSSGGYTGNVGRNKVAGLVHGQEFVVKASAARDNMPLLRAINSGASVGGVSSAGVSVSGGSVVVTPVISFGMGQLLFHLEEEKKRRGRNG